MTREADRAEDNDTPFAKFAALAKQVLSAPKDEVDRKIESDKKRKSEEK